MKRTFLLIVSCFFLLSGLSWAAGKKVNEIAVSGNRRIEKDAILAVVRTKVGEEVDSAQIRRDSQAIFRMGYFRDVAVSYDESRGRLTYKVEEKTTIREIKFVGNSDQKREDLEKEISTKPFSYVDANRIREDVDKLKAFYDSKGFYLADISSDLKDLEGNEVSLTFKIEEKKKVLIRQINFIGNRAFGESELKAVLRTKEKGFFSFISDSGAYREELLAQDRQVLRDYYGHHGYIRVKVAPPRVQLSLDKSSLSLTFVIEEGDLYRVGSIDLDGDFIKPKAELQKSIKLKEGEVADTLLIQQDISGLSTIYADEGYAYVNVIPRDTYDEAKKIVNLSYLLQPGQKVWVERISITGNQSTRDKVLRRELRIQEGELYNSTKIRESRQNIERLALFEEVKVFTPRGSADDRVNISIEVKEKPTGSFSIGAGFNTLESFQVIGQVQKRNLFGYGVDLMLDARVGGRTQAFNLQYRDEYLLDSKVGLTINAFNISRRYSNFDLTSRGATVGFDYPIYMKGLERIRAGVTYGIVNEILSDIRPTVENLFEGGITSSVTFSVSRDTRNRVFEPSKGTLFKLTEELAGSAFGGDNAFSKTEFDARWFFPVADESRVPVIGGSVFALHLETGFVAPIEDGKRVPLFERYFPGGFFLSRGFQLRSLGPQIQVATSSDPSAFTTDDFTVGGNKQIIFNAEYIFPIIRAANINGVLFFDMGNAFDNGESLFTIAGQRQSVGFGVRWFAPIGPLRFEWGFPLDKKEDESTVVFDFTIGSMF